MKRAMICKLFNEPNTKDGFQMAMCLLGRRLKARNWRLSGRAMHYMGFSISRDVVAFHASNLLTYEISVDEAIDCISGNLDGLLKYKP